MTNRRKGKNKMSLNFVFKLYSGHKTVWKATQNMRARVMVLEQCALQVYGSFIEIYLFERFSNCRTDTI